MTNTNKPQPPQTPHHHTTTPNTTHHNHPKHHTTTTQTNTTPPPQTPHHNHPKHHTTTTSNTTHHNHPKHHTTTTPNTTPHNLPKHHTTIMLITPRPHSSYDNVNKTQEYKNLKIYWHSADFSSSAPVVAVGYKTSRHSSRRQLVSDCGGCRTLLALRLSGMPQGVLLWSPAE
ncbi:hypothetical protein Pcinc_029432 [Petrolisthes cinctipes]|uniref:Uncharacterized protein n=1 Tax=Petrolisthes cinctipes TaxID=88211 RepID=A0AAE1F030_PETCI|nr:hypothetical protein Pcinc_029432 [Petrolisthes cinctipes]